MSLAAQVLAQVEQSPWANLAMLEAEASLAWRRFGPQHVATRKARAEHKRAILDQMRAMLDARPDDARLAVWARTLESEIRELEA
ncbi:MAG TPA: hypothetical protein VFZ21_31030 [Gemmatimonadaceae bacterium]|nr:hypothetical protein [Gemmatimonadaceae bacterium]